VTGQVSGVGKSRMRAQAAFVHLPRLAHANQRCQIPLKAPVVGAVQRDRRLRIRPGAVKQQRKAVMEQIGKRAEAGVLMMINTLAGVFGHVDRQRAVRAKQAEAEDRHLMQPAFFALAYLSQRRRRKTHRRLLADAQRLKFRQRRVSQRVALAALGINAP